MLRKGLAIGLLATFAIASAPTSALAGDDTGGNQTPQQREEAKTHYLQGVDLFEEGDYQNALIEFKKSYELVPNFNVLYNIGQTYFQLQDYANALKTLSQYLDDGGKRIPASRRAEVEGDVDKLKSRVATVTVKVNVPGADILVDDVKVGQSPLPGPITVSAGRRRFDAQKAGFRATPRVEEIAGQDTKEVTLDLQPSTTVIREDGKGNGGDTRVIFVPGKKDEEPGPPIAPIVMWSVTGALGIGAGVFGALALVNDSDLQAMKQEPGHTPDELESAASTTRTMAIVTDVFLGTTVVAAGFATYFTIDAVLNPPAKASDKKDTQPTPPAPAAVLKVGPGFTGVVGTF
jgi:hypothetical protein